MGTVHGAWNSGIRAAKKIEEEKGNSAQLIKFHTTALLIGWLTVLVAILY